MSLRIRAAEPGDASAIRAVHLAAFPTPLEAGLVDELERDGDAVVSLVAEEDGAVVGHVLLSRMTTEAEGRHYRALGLAPIAVRPESQRAGIGGQLVRAALAAARSLGEELVFLVGEPAYYGRFGFHYETARPFTSPYAGPYFMAIRLDESLPRPNAGTTAYAPTFSSLGDDE